MKRRVHRSDLNQESIIAALRKIGCQVYVIGEPFDLLAWYRGRWSVLEVKRPKGAYTDLQVRDMALLGPTAVKTVRSDADAIYAVCEGL